MGGGNVCTGNNGTIYDQFHAPTIKGNTSLHEASAAYAKAATEYDQHAEDLKKALAGIKVSYTGTAADQMQGAFDPLIKSMGDGHTIATAASKSLDTQTGHFTLAQSKINQTKPVPDAPWYEPIDPWNTDHDDAVEENNKINDANSKAFSEYVDNTQSNKLPQFTDTNVYNTGNISVTGGEQVHSGNPDQAVGGYNGPHGGGGGTSHATGGGGGSAGGHTQGTGGTGGSYASSTPGGSDGPVNPPGSVGPGSYTGTQGAGGGGGTGYPGGYPGGFNPGGYNPGDGAAAYGGGFGPTGGFGGAGGGSFGGGGGGGAGGGAGGGKFGGGAGIGGSAGGASGAGAKGAGAMSGAGAAAAEEAAGRGSVAGAKGAAGAAGAGGMAGGQRGGGKKEDDGEHKAADYLVNDDFASDITGDIPPALPAGGVIGF